MLPLFLYCFSLCRLSGRRLTQLIKASLFISCLFISGCLTTADDDTSNAEGNKRASLSDLADSRPNVKLAPFKLNKAARAAKLAEIYQQLLSLEPNTEIRTKVEYRLVQISTDAFENQAFGGTDTDGLEGNDSEGDNSKSESQPLTLAQLEKDEEALQKLVVSYQRLLQRYPERGENEHLQYQLAKALDLQGKLEESLTEMELLLSQYPATKYVAELNFRRGEIYYNLQDYSAALTAYGNVINANNNDKYVVNSLYMSGWALFKQNRLPEADNAFLQVLEAIVAAEKEYPNPNEFSFATLNSRYQNLAIDTQRVLSVSLSQQQQSDSLVKLVTKHQSSKFLPLYRHVLFENLADFLIKKELIHDAEITYQAYIQLAKDTLWSARFSLALLELYHREGRFAAMHHLKNDYVEQYGLEGRFWQQATPSIQKELLPHLLKFSDEQARRTYANAQEKKQGAVRVNAFSDAATALATYLKLAKLPDAEALLSKNILSDEYLYADANFEALQYKTALTQYENIAYFSQHVTAELEQLKLQSAYATTITIRKILKNSTVKGINNNAQYQQLINERNRFDKLFIEKYPNDHRSLALATHVVQYAFNAKDYTSVQQLSSFVLNAHGVITKTAVNAKAANITVANSALKPALTPVLKPAQKPVKKLSATALKQVQIVSQLSAHSFYQQKRYRLAEDAYTLALNYADKKVKTRQEMRNLLASSIYFQAQVYKVKQPELAVYHLLRVGKVIPESAYRITAEFDAANLLLNQQLWQQAIDVLLAIKKSFPTHKYAASIPAKLAKSYEVLGQWELAAEQLLIIVSSEKSIELKREAQYTAAEYYLKAGNTTKALITYRTYAHAYPEPFDVAQEVRFKMSEFYRHSKETNKQYFWFRKMLSAHAKQSKTSPQVIQARAIELASTAAFGLGRAHQQTFKWIKLKTPLQKSLSRKQAAMKQAIKYYQQVLGFQLAHYVPQATFNLAEMYRQLAVDVMKSERPSDLEELALEEYDILLEELAYPFEEKAIEIHQSNAKRAWQNIYDEWVVKSFDKLAELDPALYNKKERDHDVIDAIY